MQLTSTSFEHEGLIPPQYTCDGENINPHLAIHNVPEEAQSLVLICDDPDAPGGTFVHWVVWNIHPQTEQIKEGAVLDGAVEGISSFGNKKYGGPCPPSGSHRYYFKIYALDTLLDLTPDTEKEGVVEAMKEHIVDQAEIMGRYERK